MEFHKKITDDSFSLSLNKPYSEYFAEGLRFVNKYYKEDFDRISLTDFNTITPEFFFQEVAWVICASGFNAKIVSRFFPKLMEICVPLKNVINGNLNVNTLDIAVQALDLFNNKNKIKAIIDSAFILGEGMEKSSWAVYRDTQLNTPDKLKIFPFIGDITKYHLARNIGLIENVKPDLHLNRAAKHWGFSGALELCEELKKECKMPLGLIDLVLWYSLSSFGSKIK
jgi:hypothetical protein